jgi:uncharacterized membrane protein
VNTEDSEIRIARLEKALQELQERIDQLESRGAPAEPKAPAAFAAPASPPAAPPVVEPPPPVIPPPVVAPPPFAPAAKPATPPDNKPQPVFPHPPVINPGPIKVAQPASSMSDPDDLEYKLGINGLLRGGAFVVFVGMLFLAAVMFSRGYVNTRVQFAGELLLCLGFIGVGFWKRNEREEFGQLMVGIGSGGLYASFAGAHLYKHLFEGETLVALYVVLSLLNFGFAQWRASKSFWALGLLGGFAAAMMPMRESKAVLDVSLHFLILIPAAWIVIKNRWYKLAALSWLVSSAALIPILSANVGPFLQMLALYANTGIGLYAIGRLYEPNDFDRDSVIPALVVFVTGIAGFGAEYEKVGTLHLLAFGAIVAAVGALLPSTAKAKTPILFSGLATMLIFVPMGFRAQAAGFLYLLEAVCLGAVIIRWPKVPLFVLNLVTTGLALIAYELALGQLNMKGLSMAVWPEIGLLSLIAVSVLLSVRFCLRNLREPSWNWGLGLGSLLLSGLFMRFAIVTLPLAPLGFGITESGALGAALAALACTAYHSSKPNRGLLLTTLFTGFWSGGYAISREPTQHFQWLTLVLLGLTALNATWTTLWVARTYEDGVRKPVLVMCGTALSIIFVRATQILGANRVGPFNDQSIVYLCLAILSVAWLVVAMRFRRTESFILAWGAWLVCCVSSITAAEQSNLPWIGHLMQGTALFSLATLYAITPRKASDEGPVTLLCALAGWGLAGQLMTEFLRSPAVGMNQVSSITAGWVFYALVLIVVGFRLDRRYLRYASLGVFGVTIGKVFLIDLAALDSMIRVGILLLLGLVMIGAGYWYILWRRSRTEKTL